MGGDLATVIGKPRSAEGREIQVHEVWSQPDAKRLEELAGELARGTFTIPVAKRLKLAEVRQAHTLAEKGGGGKIVLNP